MKGRRKVKTCKRHMKSTVETETRAQLQKRSEKQGGLLDIAVLNDRKLEPAGRLAG